MGFDHADVSFFVEIMMELVGGRGERGRGKGDLVASFFGFFFPRGGGGAEGRFNLPQIKSPFFYFFIFSYPFPPTSLSPPP